MEKNQTFRIFVIEDNLIQQRLIQYAMELNPDHQVHTFGTGQECIDNLHLNPEIISLDYNLPDMRGEAVLAHIKKYNKNIRVIILSGQQEVDTAIDLLRKGADEYLTKGPQMKKRLWHSVQTLKDSILLNNEIHELKKELGSKYKYKNIIGNSQVMQKVTDLIDKATKSNITVSITGETGTGKEVVAKSIHYNSNRHDKKFIAINMAAIPKHLMESELFGYEKGAFTGADNRKSGKFELADGGTLFLDEIGDLDLTLQVKLLRALQEQEVTRLGGHKAIQFDTRIIVATHRSLTEEVEKGNFREDLYYRLLGLSIHLPPLKERGRDILMLAKFFLQEYAKENNVPAKSLSQQAKDVLLKYDFPGNVRELKSIMELASVFAETSKIKKTELQFQRIKKDFGLLEGEMSMQEYTKKIIRHYLEKYNNDVVLVSQKLNIGRSTIYKRLKDDAEKN